VDDGICQSFRPMNEAVLLHGARDARVALFNLRESRPGETLVEVAAVGICGSDLHCYKGGIGSAIIHEQFVPGPARPLVSPASE
jgi:L-iditol 2-dehydrogenase